MKVVCKIIYPNGKIYVGKDMTGAINYFGSAQSALIAVDFSPEQRLKFRTTREILWSSATVDSREVAIKEVEFIRKL